MIGHYKTAIMDAATIYAVLAEGKIGEMPFPEYLDQIGRGLDDPDYFWPAAKALAKLDIVALRWEPGDNNPDEERLWQAYLVVTLPSEPAPSLKLIHDIAVGACGSYYYVLKGEELWIEYLVARPEAVEAIEATLEAGKIGEMSLPKYFEYQHARTGIWFFARTLANYGVVSVRWDEDEWIKRWVGIEWQAYIVASLPISSAVSPPSLPSHELLRTLVLHIPAVTYYRTDVTETGVELWISLRVKLPLEEEVGELVEVLDRITVMSYAGKKAQRARAMARRRALWKALVNFVRRSNI